MLKVFFFFFRDDSKLSDETHTVVATARGVFDSNGGVLESKDTGKSYFEF